MSDIFSFGDSTPPDLSSLTFSSPDLSSLTSGLTMPTQVGGAAGGDIISGFNDFIKNIGGVATTVFQTQAQINQAQAQAAIANAQGQNAVKTAQAGVPSPNMLILGGAGLLALVLLTSKK